MTAPIVGDRHRLVLVDDLTRTRIVQYAGASGDFNPLHTDEVYATAHAGHPGTFAHGMLTMGMAGRVVTEWFGIEALRAYRARFLGQVWPGDALVAVAVVTAVAPRSDPPGSIGASVSIEVTNQKGAVVLAGTAEVELAADDGGEGQR